MRYKVGVSGLEISSVSSLYGIIESIKNYHYNTIQGTKELTLNLKLQSIILDPTYPYYDFGIRGVEFDDLIHPKCLYVSMNFISENHRSLLFNLINRYQIVVCDYSDYNKKDKYVFVRGLRFLNYDLKETLNLSYLDYKRTSNLMLKDWLHLNSLEICLNFNMDAINFVFIDSFLEEYSLECLVKSYMDYFRNLYYNCSFTQLKHHIFFYFYHLKDEEKLNQFFNLFIQNYLSLDENIKYFIYTQISFEISVWNNLRFNVSILDKLDTQLNICCDFHSGPLLWNLDFLYD